MKQSSALSPHSGSNGQDNKHVACQSHPLYYSEILSLSTTLLPQIRDSWATGETVGIFTRAANILVDGNLIALVLPNLGNGPFHFVVNKLPKIIPGQPLHYCWDGERLDLGESVFHSTPATRYWDPRPHWELLDITRVKCSMLQDNVRQVLAQNMRGSTHSQSEILHILTASRLDDFWRCLRDKDSQGFIHAASELVGRGPGLTPTGDDFLAGFMLSLWTLHHPDTKKICGWIVEAAQQRTTYISIAYLKVIAAGYADERWHQFLDALNCHNTQLLFSATSHILDFGATSGSDMLYGFLSGIEFQQCMTGSEIKINGRKP